jgi:flagellar hook assembly protein FlgD
MIMYALPSGKTGTVKIEIYTMAGDLVRTITDNATTGGAYYYAHWDGKNDGGKKVASGVYVGRLTVNGNDEKFFKMAVIK